MKETRPYVVLLCLIIVFSLLNGCDPGQQTDMLYLQNGLIRLGFDPRTGSLRLFQDQVREYSFLDEKHSAASPWHIITTTAAGSDTIDFTAAKQFDFKREGRLALVMKWQQFPAAFSNLAVTVTVSLEEKKPNSRWKISLQGLRGTLTSQVTFPRLAGLLDPGNEKLAVPQWMGQILDHPRQHLSELNNPVKKFEWSYPGQLSLQCLALYNTERCGLYAACDDTSAFLKNFSIALQNSNRLLYAVHNFPALDSTVDSYEPAYSAIIGSFKGDWLTAAEQYRDWGTRQWWCKEARFKRSTTPDWLENTALWIWNRGKSPNVLQPAADLQQRLGLPVSVFWHWWHGCLYDDGFPEYLPPREGKASFKSAMATAHDQGLHAMVYMNQVLWGTSTRSWHEEHTADHSARNIQGETISHVFNIFTNRALAYMCMATPFWKDKYAMLCDSVLNDYQADGVYMDMACLSLRCYDQRHGHPVGGGRYWVEHFGRLAGQIRARVNATHQAILAGEGCAEAWLPYLDLFLTLAVSKERYAGVGSWETIPFFQAVYHEYGITYGNYSSLVVPPYDELWPKKYAPKKPRQLLDGKFNKQFLMEQARSFVWGMQPCIANYYPFLAQERAPELLFLLQLARVRNMGLKYLLAGRFMRSPDMLFPELEFDVSRLSIYAGKRGESVLSFRKSFPLLYAGTWLAGDGDIAIALANIGDEPYDLDSRLSAAAYSLPESGSVSLITADGKKTLTDYSQGHALLRLTVPSRSVCLVEISGKRSR